jgi:hypothetical protein
MARTRINIIPERARPAGKTVQTRYRWLVTETSSLEL